MKRALSIAALVTSFAVPAWAAPPPLGAEFQVNTYTVNSQSLPAVASAADASFVVVWGSVDQDGPFGSGVFGQRYDSNGAPAGDEFQVNTHTQLGQDVPAVARGAGGDFVVVWRSVEEDGDFFGVFAQRYASTGTPLGSPFQVNTYTRSAQTSVAVASNADGRFVVVWRSGSVTGTQDGSTAGIFGQRYASSGTPLGTEFQVNRHTLGYQERPRVTLDMAGAFVVVWESGGQDGSFDGIFGRRFDSNGVALGTEFQVNTYTPYGQLIAGLAGHPEGNFMVAWNSYGSQDGSGTGVFGQRYDNSGVRVGTEFQINTYTPGNQKSSALTSDGTGNFALWNSSGQDGSSYGVFGRRYAAGGTAVGGEFQVNLHTINAQGFPAAASDAAGNLVVVWESGLQDGFGSGAFGRRFGACAAPLTGCRTAQKSILLIKQTTPDDDDKLIWKWIKGQATTQAEFADPTAMTDYLLCVYDGDGFVLAAEVHGGAACAGNPCWKATSNGYKYKDDARTQAGVQKVVLKGSTEPKAKALVKGKGVNLPDPTLQLSGTVTAQLVNAGNGLCFEGTYSGSEIIKNDPDFFKAKSISP